MTPRKPRVWDDESVRILRDLYPDHDTEDVAIIIGTSVDSVRSMAFKLDIKKSPEGLRLAIESSMRNGASKGWIKKGSVPPNKGRKGLYPTTESMRRTQFKKGHLPHNTKQVDGHVSVRPDKTGRLQKFIRVGLGKWITLIKYNWEAVNGPVPSGMVLRCKDGDSMNTDISNIECISKRLNMLLNSVHEYPREIAEVRDVLCELKNVIKEKEPK